MENMEFEDWTLSGLLNPVRSQGDGECCYAVVGCEALETLYHADQNQNNGRRVELSPQDVWNNIEEAQEDEEEQGCTIYNTLRWISINGCVLEENCPYTGVLGPVVLPRPVRMRIVTYVPIPHRHLEYHVRHGGPVIVEVDWLREMDNLQGDTIYSGPRHASDFRLAAKHAMAVVGFGSEMVGNQLVNFWIMRNSHGTHWGNHGYGRFNRARIHNRFLVNNGWQARGISYRTQEGRPYLAM